MKSHQKNQPGFTLIELMVTISIAAILASIAVPSFSKMIERNRISSATNEFLSALVLGRSEAVKRSQSVSVCVSNAAQTACDATTTAKDYAKGWIVFAECPGGTSGFIDNTGTNVCDTDGDGTLDAGETIIRVHGELSNLSITSSDGDALNKHDDFVLYDFSGRSDDFSFYIGKDASTKTKELDLSRTGRVRACDYSASPAGC